MHYPLPSKLAERKWSEEDFRDYDFVAERDSSGDDDQSFGQHESLEDDDPYGVRHSRGGDKQDGDPVSADGSNDEWGWDGEEDEVRDEEYPPETPQETRARANTTLQNPSEA